MTQRHFLTWLLLALLLAPATNYAEDPPADEETVDEELLEFLGSVDTDDEDWIDFLSHTDVKQVAKTESPPADSEAEK